MKALSLRVLRSGDVEKARRFYELLGMSFSRHRHGTGPEHYASEDDRGVFEIYPRSGGEADATGLGFKVSNLPKAFAQFASAGYEPSPMRENPWGRSFVVRDPDGRRVEIMEAPRA